MAYAVVIDKQICQSSGNCVNEDPRAFGLDGDDLGDVLAPAGDLPRARLVEIAARCPAIAIAIFDENGDEIEVAR